MEVHGMDPAELIKLQQKAIIIAHFSPSKIIGLIQHFGLINLLYTLLRMIKNRLITLFGCAEPALHSIEFENTTLKNLGLIPGDNERPKGDIHKGA